MAKVGFTTKDGTVVSFTTKKRSTRKNESTAVAVRANKRKPAKRKPAARKPVKRAPVARGKDKATFKFYVVFRGPPKGLNIHAGFATQQAARAFITKKFKGTRRLQVRGRPGLVKSGHNPKVAANWKTFSLAASLKAAPAPRKRATRRNSEKKITSVQYTATCPIHGTRNAPWPQFGEMGFGHYGATVCWACREREEEEREARRPKRSIDTEWDI